MTTLSTNTVLHDTVKKSSGSFHPKDPVSAYTHFGGFIAAIIAMPLLLIHASAYGASTSSLISYAVFMMSMILLYGASASYHSFNVSKKVNMVLKRVDHMSIFALIAGSYTPICVVALKGSSAGTLLLTAIWNKQGWARFFLAAFLLLFVAGEVIFFAPDRAVPNGSRLF